MKPWRVPACLLSVVLWVGCSRGDDSPTAVRSSAGRASVVADGPETVAGLCLAREQASTDLRAAKATYERRSRYGIETAVRALRGSYSRVAASIAQASTAVEADLATDGPRPTLEPNLDRLTEKVREGLARLGVSTSACEN